MIYGKRGRREAPRIRPVRVFWREQVYPRLDSSVRGVHEVGRAGYRYLRRVLRRHSAKSLAVGMLCAMGVLLLFPVSQPGGLPPDQQLPSLLEDGPPTPSVPPAKPELVTREQADRLCYTDSALGALRWELTDGSLAELNRVLAAYGIDSPEEIAQFLAQATVESGAGAYLTELGDDAYFKERGYSAGTRGAGYLHLTHDYGQMAFAVWEMKRYVPELAGISYQNPANSSRESVARSYYDALQYAANLGADVSRYSRIVYDGTSSMETGAEYIAAEFAWESAGYYWHTTGVADAFSPQPGVENTDMATRRIGGKNEQSRREAYLAFYPVFAEQQER